MRTNIQLGVLASVLAVWCAGGPVLAQEHDPHVRKIVTGTTHKCGLTDSGGVKCWGYNYYGQLGDNTTVSRTIPGDVSGLVSNVTDIAAGNLHTCALTAAGGVKCWGYNFYGQLGDGGITQTLAPVNVLGLSNGVVAIATGFFHTCALTSAGGVKCWGHNTDGELGDGTVEQRAAPVFAAGLTTGAVAISAGDLHSCAKTEARGVKCWGHDSGKWEAAARQDN
jgi:alpha-tubulin suppressor-like RCC1 family protein